MCVSRNGPSVAHAAEWRQWVLRQPRRSQRSQCLPCFPLPSYAVPMSTVELAIEKIKRLDEADARQLLAGGQDQRAAMPPP